MIARPKRTIHRDTFFSVGLRLLCVALKVY